MNACCMYYRSGLYLVLYGRIKVVYNILEMKHADKDESTWLFHTRNQLVYFVSQVLWRRSRVIFISYFL